MLTTEQIKISNNKDIFSNEDLMRIFIKIDLNYGDYGNSYRTDMRDLCTSILISRKVKQFIGWLPWIKTINICKIKYYIDHRFGVRNIQYSYGYISSSRKNKYKYDKNLQIKALFALYELGYIFDTWNDVTQHIRSMIIFYLEIDDYLERILQKALNNPSIETFSVNPIEQKEKPNHYRLKHKERQLHEDRIRLHEEQAQDLRFYTTTSSTSTRYVETTTNTISSVDYHPVYTSFDDRSASYARRIINGTNTNNSSGTTRP